MERCAALPLPSAPSSRLVTLQRAHSLNLVSLTRFLLCSLCAGVCLADMKWSVVHSYVLAMALPLFLSQPSLFHFACTHTHSTFICVHIHSPSLLPHLLCPYDMFQAHYTIVCPPLSHTHSCATLTCPNHHPHTQKKVPIMFKLFDGDVASEQPPLPYCVLAARCQYLPLVTNKVSAPCLAVPPRE